MNFRRFDQLPVHEIARYINEDQELSEKTVSDRYEKNKSRYNWVEAVNKSGLISKDGETIQTNPTDEPSR